MKHDYLLFNVKSTLSVICIILLSIMPVMAEANDEGGSIKGKISTADGRPASGVTILIKGKNKGAVTDEAGQFTIKNLGIGTYELEISFVGYQTITEKVEVRTNETSTVNIQLQLTQKQLQEVVVQGRMNSYKTDEPSASLRIQTPLMETPQSIISINKTLLDDQQIFTVTDVSKNVSGVTSIFPYVGVYTDFNIRGTRTTANKLRNGMPTSGSGVLQEDLSYVENIEFVKGPAGFMLAQGEPGGMYNVVTKKPLHKTHVAANFITGSYGLYRSSIDAGSTLGEQKKLSYRLNIMGQKSGTHLDYGVNNRLSIAPVIRYDLNDATSLTLEYNFDKATVNGTFAQLPTRNGTFLRRSFSVEDPVADPLKFINHYGYINLQHQLHANWKLTAQVGSQYANQEGTLFYTTAVIGANDLLPRNYRYIGRRSVTTTGQVFLNGQFNTGNVSHTLLTGFDGGSTDSKFATVSILNVLPINVVNPVYGLTTGIDTLMDESSVVLGSPSRVTWQALTLQDDIRLTNWLHLTVGGRFTHYENNSSRKTLRDDVFTPRAGLLFQPVENTSVYLLYDRSFVAQTGTNAHGERFDPLTGNNLEFGIKREWFNKNLLTQVAVYNITKNNALTTDIDNPGFSIQTGEIKSKGVEVDVMGTIYKNWSVSANYAYTDSKITEDNDPKLVGNRNQAPLHTTNAWVKYTFTQGALTNLGLGIGGSYYAKQYTFTTKKNATDPQATLPDYKSLNAALYYKVGHLSFGLNIDNITNEFNFIGNYNYNLGTQGEYVYIVMPGTNWRLSITYKL
jgi:iron complex outermembrane receptor protein